MVSLSIVTNKGMLKNMMNAKVHDWLKWGFLRTEHS